MLRLEQMADGSNTVYKLEYIEHGVTIVKYFKDVDNASIDETQLKSVENGLHIEIK